MGCCPSKKVSQVREEVQAEESTKETQVQNTETSQEPAIKAAAEPAIEVTYRKFHRFLFTTAYFLTLWHMSLEIYIIE